MTPPPRPPVTMSRRFAAASALAGLLAAAPLWSSGCSSGTDAPDGEAAGDGGKPRVALIMKSLANEFFATMAEGAETHQAAHADQYDLIVNGIKDERDLSRQVALVEEMVAAGVDAIVIAPADSKALVPALRRAEQAGVTVVNIDNRLDAEILRQDGVTIPFVGPDNAAGAERAGAYLAETLGKGDWQVGVLEGVRTSENARARKAGFEAAMADAGIEIVDSQSAEWEMSRASTVAASMLSEHPEIDALLAANDSMALGALSAVKSAGREGEVLIVGFDNIGAVREAIRDGKILATVDQHGDELAVFGIEAALRELAGEPAAGDVETAVDLVTAETIAAEAKTAEAKSAEAEAADGEAP
ncbi:sugar ABC transporter substrate-binding protein [Alienimonas californiensis]|uniref:D-ribose-binding periplasmic protein n=1 Tax=Alienimonas californiensis TaxID=2527989 RepID=A0A517P8P0_9PLAN|nr:sugar ABC transporter substrate-binding protein [Alienimonas californiensis]QDT15743.1 D-ribose-binding periplasmic protein precursor [Alienimonas californiensis]